MKRSWPDWETSVSFLCTRVNFLTKEDCRKLRRVLNYLKATKYDKRVMGSDTLLKIETWVDASHAVHEYMRGHTRGCTYHGVGIIHDNASKKKLNTKSTT